MVDDAKEIVGKLTEAQRVILLGARPADSFEYWTSAPICAPPLTGLDCVLNQLGIEVRALLHKEQCDG